MKKLFILLLDLIFNRGLFSQACMGSKPFAITDSTSDNIHCALTNVRYPAGAGYSDSIFVFWERSGVYVIRLEIGISASPQAIDHFMTKKVVFLK